MEEIRTLFRACTVAIGRGSENANFILRELHAALIAKCEEDPEFYALAKSDPRAALLRAGISLPSEVGLRTVVAMATERILLLPPMHGDALMARSDVEINELMRRDDGRGPVTGPERDELPAPRLQTRTVHVRVLHKYSGGLPIGKKGDDIWEVRLKAGEFFEGVRLVAAADRAFGARLDAQSGVGQRSGDATAHWWFNWCYQVDYDIHFRISGNSAASASIALTVDHDPTLYPPVLDKLTGTGVSLRFANVF